MPAAEDEVGENNNKITAEKVPKGLQAAVTPYLLWHPLRLPLLLPPTPLPSPLVQVRVQALWSLRVGYSLLAWSLLQHHPAHGDDVLVAHPGKEVQRGQQPEGVVHGPAYNGRGRGRGGGREGGGRGAL